MDGDIPQLSGPAAEASAREDSQQAPQADGQLSGDQPEAATKEDPPQTLQADGQQHEVAAETSTSEGPQQPDGQPQEGQAEASPRERPPPGQQADCQYDDGKAEASASEGSQPEQRADFRQHERKAERLRLPTFEQIGAQKMTICGLNFIGQISDRKAAIQLRILESLERQLQKPQPGRPKDEDFDLTALSQLLRDNPSMADSLAPFLGRDLIEQLLRGEDPLP